MNKPEPPPTICIVGNKNNGKTTLLVALAAELKRRGYRVASVKHGHHAAEIDHPGRDSWRHFHEGEVEAVVLASAGRLAVVMRTPEPEPEPDWLVERFLSGHGYDVVLVEGYKHGPLPKIEIYRRAAGQDPIFRGADAAAAALFLGIVTDDAEVVADCPVIPLDPSSPTGSHVQAVAELISVRLGGGPVAT